MKVLYTSKFIPPYAGGSSEITENLAMQFAREQMVVVGESYVFGRKIEYDRGGEDSPKFYYIPTEWSLRGRGRRFFNWLIWLSIPYIVYRMTSVLKKERCNYVLGTFPTNYFCFAALLSARLCKVGFSSYFHNTLVENRKGFNKWFSNKIQRVIFEWSDNIFVMSDGMMSFYENSYPDVNKFEVLPHTFSDYPDVERSEWRRKNRYRLVLVGNFNASNIDATRRFIEAVSVHDRYEIYMYTSVPMTLLQLRGINSDLVRHMGFIDKNQLLKELGNYDICVLTHGFTGAYSNIEYKTIFPTRTIPFLLSGRPIIAHSPRGAFLTDFLLTHQCAEVVDSPNKELILEGLDKIISDDNWRRVMIENAFSAVHQFYGPIVANNLKAKILK